MENIISIRKSWDSLQTADAAQTPLANSNKDWASKPADARVIDSRLNIIELGIIFRGEASAAVINLYVYRQGGPAMRVCTFTATAGEMEVVQNPVTQAADTGKYADEISNLTGYWTDTIKSIDSAGADGFSRIQFDGYGAAVLYAEITSITGNGAVEVIYSGV